jgi:hypothetical protein
MRCYYCEKCWLDTETSGVCLSKMDSSLRNYVELDAAAIYSERECDLFSLRPEEEAPLDTKEELVYIAQHAQECQPVLA